MIVNTREWLDEDFSNPVSICKHFEDLFDDGEAGEIYHYLQSHGMYRPSRRVQRDYEQLVERDVWKELTLIAAKYRKLWGGPDVPIYVFPFQLPGFFSRSLENKSGLAFKDKMFLFVQSNLKNKELEALFVHEYHHVCRLNEYKKKPAEYTLLDSMVMEGLAEQAVSKHVGPEYLANWTSLYEDKEIEQLWSTHVREHLKVKQTDSLHLKIMIGKQSYPKMIGYCSGFYMAKKMEEMPFEQSFHIPSETLFKKITPLHE